MLAQTESGALCFNMDTGSDVADTIYTSAKAAERFMQAPITGETIIKAFAPLRVPSLNYLRRVPV